MPWTLFDQAAEGYESWYTSPQGRRADAAERALLEWLLASFPAARSLLEIGCGTGHFTAWLAQHSPVVREDIKICWPIFRRLTKERAVFSQI